MLRAERQRRAAENRSKSRLEDKVGEQVDKAEQALLKAASARTSAAAAPTGAANSPSKDIHYLLAQLALSSDGARGQHSAHIRVWQRGEFSCAVPRSLPPV
jgi:hypothetical protein